MPIPKRIRHPERSAAESKDLRLACATDPAIYRPALKRFASSRYAPGTNSGNCR